MAGIKTDYYSILNIPPDATQDEIRAAYFEAAKRYHPDVNPDKETQLRFLKIQEAYEVLSNLDRRQTYDAGLPAAYRETAAVNYFTQYSQSVLPVLDEPQLFYALLELECTKGLNPQDLPSVHICLVVDRSTSMRGERMDMVRSNISKLVRSMRPKDKLTIVAFSDKAEVIVPISEVSEPHLIDSVMNHLSVGGATEIYQGLQAGVEMIQRYELDNHFKNLILITDGHTYGDEIACIDLAHNAGLDGISIYCLGIGEDWNDAFLDKLASASGGNSIYVRNKDDLQNFIEQKLKSINFSYAQNLQLHFELDPQVMLNYVFRLHPDVSTLRSENPISIGSLEYGKKTSIILEFKLSPKLAETAELVILRGKITLEAPSLKNPYSRLLINLRRPVRKSHPPEKPPTSILNAMSHLTLYRLQEKARKEVESGNILEASRRLQYLATHLMAQGNRELAKTVLVEAEQIQRTSHFSKEGEKAIKYGTRGLFLLPDPERKPL